MGLSLDVANIFTEILARLLLQNFSCGKVFIQNGGVHKTRVQQTL